MSIERPDPDFLIDLKKHITTAKSDKYVGRKFDVIDLLEDQHCLEGFAVGNAIKYLVRFHKRANKTDLLKAGHYLQMLYERC